MCMDNPQVGSSADRGTVDLRAQAAKPVRRQAQDTRQPAASLSAFTRAEATASQAQDDAEGDNAEGQGPDGMEDTGPAGSIFSDDDDAGGYGGPNFDDAEDHGDGELQPPPFWAPPSLDGQQVWREVIGELGSSACHARDGVVREASPSPCHPNCVTACRVGMSAAVRSCWSRQPVTIHATGWRPCRQ